MADKPNILLIYADQMRHDCAGFSGNPDVKTPHLDRLAMEGVCFDEAYVSYPLCRPFRASLLTGKYAHRTGAYNNREPIAAFQQSLAHILNSFGYASGYVGKWHLHNGLMKPGFVPPGPDRMGFDDFVGFNRDHNYMDAIFYRDSDQPYNCKRFEPDFQTDHAIEFMERALASGVPFLTYVSFGPPHPPMRMPEHWLRMYDPKRIQHPTGSTKHQKEHIRSGTGEDWDRKRQSPIYESEKAVRTFLSGYYSLISGIDYNVGRLLNWLDAKCIAENTMVIFFSDHGDMLGQNGSHCGMKALPFRAAAQVPLLVRYPGRFVGDKRVDSLVDVAVDTMPTLLETCGIDAPRGTQGISYLTLLEGSGIPTRDHVQYQIIYGHPRKSNFKKGRELRNSQRGIRTKDWLYVRDRDQPIYLFDQNADRGELSNQADDPGHAEILEELDGRVRRNMEQTEDAWEIGITLPPLTHVTAEKLRELRTTHRKNEVRKAIEAP